MKRSAVSVVLILCLPILIAGSARAQQTLQESYVDSAAEGLATNPVYVHPDAEDLVSESEAEELAQQIAAANAGPVYIAVLPEEATAEGGGDPGGLIPLIGGQLGRQATLIVVAGRELRAGSNTFDQGVVPGIADEAVAENQGADPAELLSFMIDRLGAEAAGEGSSGDSGGGIGLFPLLLLGGGAFYFLSSRRRRKAQQVEEARQLQEVKQAALDDLVALGEELRSLDLDVEMPGVNPEAKRYYTEALTAYETATAKLDSAARPEDLRVVTSSLEEGMYDIACARALLHKQPIPERRPPCFFDPRHGPSVRDVVWAPPGGEPREVPACASDAARVDAGEEPESRLVEAGGMMTPLWGAPAYFSPWYGGYFGMFGGGLMNTMLLGTMLGGFGGWGMGGHGMGGGFGDSGGGGGDFGGGDFGGFGGGDFGGGDFGGGDF